jgi:peptide/nickel transport system permease protein
MSSGDTYEALLASGGHGLLKQAWRNFLKNRLAVSAFLFLILIHLAGYLAPWIAPHPYERIDLMSTLTPPSAQHLLGTDESGRDVFSRLLYGARISLSVGLVTMTISLTLGTLLGAIAGFTGRWVDSLIMRFTDGMLCIPLFFFMLTFLALMGSSMSNIILAIALSSWMPAARVVRGEVLS